LSRACDLQKMRARPRSRPVRGLRVVILLALGGFFQVPVAAARDVVRVESVGVAAVRPESVSPRDTAVRKALLDAVRLTAGDLLATGADDEFDEEPGDVVDPESDDVENTALQRILGNDPLDYITRFQVVEDRGEGPALFGSDLDVETEYVVIVSVFVDRDRIRARLTRAGMMLTPAGQQPEIRSRLILDDIGEYWVYAEIRRVLLEELKLRSAIPREFTPGRAILELNAAQSPSEFLPSLQRSVSDRMNLILLGVDDDEMHLRVEVHTRPAPDERFGAGRPIDTPSPNRY
jgi:hypothetical protein